MKITDDNYYSLEANKEFGGYSSFKTFLQCQARYYAQNITGEYIFPTTKSMMLGKLVESLVLDTEKEAEKFAEDNKGTIYQGNGKIYATFKNANDMADAVKKQPVLMEHLEGNTQEIITFDYMGVKFKCKFDVVNSDKKMLTDFKTTQSFTKKTWNDWKGEMMVWWDNYFYSLQATIYSDAYNSKYGDYPEYYIVGVTSQDPADVGLFKFTTDQLEDADWILRNNIEEFKKVREGRVKPKRCEKCPYCVSTKVIEDYNYLQWS